MGADWRVYRGYQPPNYLNSVITGMNAGFAINDQMVQAEERDRQETIRDIFSKNMTEDDQGNPVFDREGLLNDLSGVDPKLTVAMADRFKDIDSRAFNQRMQEDKYNYSKMDAKRNYELDRKYKMGNLQLGRDRLSWEMLKPRGGGEQGLTMHEKEMSKARTKRFMETEAKRGDLDSQVDILEDSIKTLGEWSRDKAVTTGPVADWIPDLSDRSQRLDQNFKRLNFVEITNRLQGMSRLGDSNVERKAFEGGQPGMDRNPEVNMQKLLGMTSLAKKQALIQDKRQEFLDAGNRSLLNFDEDFYADRISSVVDTQNGEVIVVDKANKPKLLQSPRFMSLDQYAELATNKKKFNKFRDLMGFDQRKGKSASGGGDNARRIRAQRAREELERRRKARGQ